MKLRVGDPWMPSSEYSRTLKGLTINILVKELEYAVRFAKDVLRAEIVYSDPDFAVASGYGSDWMYHADHTTQQRVAHRILIVSVVRVVHPLLPIADRHRKITI